MSLDPIKQSWIAWAKKKLEALKQIGDNKRNKLQITQIQCVDPSCREALDQKIEPPHSIPLVPTTLSKFQLLRLWLKDLAL
jgi:hypothetical protein